LGKNAAFEVMDFAKVHGLGNDFLIVKAGEFAGKQASLASLAIAICERHCGVGADGILFFQPTIGDTEADFSTLIYNADGSRAEMSGNGVRCLAAWFFHSGQHKSPQVRIRTVSGIKTLTLKEQRDCSYHFECSMGHPILDPIRVPVNLGERGKPLLDYPLSCGSEVVKICVCSLGNPHCTTFWDDLSKTPVESLGQALEQHCAFPSRTNVEFVQVVDRHRLKVLFWERGVGATLASGTGSSAAAVAAILLGRADSPLTVETTLGNLHVKWAAHEELFLSGPATVVCAGAYYQSTANSALR
jgi:diaminopimelate epimerase